MKYEERQQVVEAVMVRLDQMKTQYLECQEGMGHIEHLNYANEQYIAYHELILKALDAGYALLGDELT